MKNGIIKLIKRQKVILLVTALLLLLSSIGYGYFIHDSKVLAANQTPEIRESQNLLEPIAMTESFEVLGPKTVRVILETVYLDGEVSEEIVEETIWSMEDFWAEYEAWNLIDLDDVQIVFQQNVNDISPLLKLNGYFGLSEEGILSIYNGKPDEENVIQSFFHINTDKLKSHQHVQLKKGIPVISREKYEEVINTFKQYERKI